MALYVGSIINQIAAKTEDSGNAVFTRAQILESLDLQQTPVMSFLDKGYWTPLEAKKASLSCTSGVSALTAAQLGYDVFGGRQGIMRVKITGGRYCTEVRPEQLNRYQAGGGMDASIMNPLWWVEANQLNVDCGSTVTNPVVDVLFYRKPNTLKDVFTMTTASSTTSFTVVDSDLSTVDDTYNGAVIYCITNNTYHVITDYTGSPKTFTVSPAKSGANFLSTDTFYFVSHDFDQLGLAGVQTDVPIAAIPALIEMTCSDLWARDNRLDRAVDASNRAISMINILNERVKNIKGLGTHTREEGR